MEMNFCRRCGSTLTHSQKHVYTCTNGHTLFANASPAVAIWLVNSKNQVLVAKRAIEPGIGLLDAPGGFIDGDTETFEEALDREIKEEIGIKNDQYSTPIYLRSSIDHYAYGNEKIPVLSAFYWARVADSAIFTPMDDVASVEFMDIDSIQLDDVCFVAAKESLAELKKSL